MQLFFGMLFALSNGDYERKEGIEQMLRFHTERYGVFPEEKGVSRLYGNNYCLLFPFFTASLLTSFNVV